MNCWIYWQYDGDVQRVAAALRKCPNLTHLTLQASYHDSRITKETVKSLLRLPDVKSLHLELQNLPFCKDDSLLYHLIGHNSMVSGLRSLHYHASNMYVTAHTKCPLNTPNSPQLEEIIIFLDGRQWESYFKNMARHLMPPLPPRETIIHRLLAMVSCGSLQKAKMIRLLRPTTDYRNKQQALLAYDFLAQTNRYSLLPRNADWDADGHPLFQLKSSGDHWKDLLADRYVESSWMWRRF